MNLLDIISKGRVSYTLGIGYRPEEFEHFGVNLRRRGRVAEEKLQLLLRLRTGDTVEHEGRRIRVTPPPFTPGGPRVMWGGGSVAAAQRAGRYGLALQANAEVPGMREAYEAACRANGHVPGPVLVPDGTPPVMFVADDVDAAWAELGPHLLHDAKMYSSWNPGDQTTALITHATSIEQLRTPSSGYRIMSVADATDYVADGGVLRLAPLCGGIPPDVAWPYLKLAANVAASASQA